MAVEKPIDAEVLSIPSRQASDEKIGAVVGVATLDAEVKAVHDLQGADDRSSDTDSEDVIIITGSDAAKHLLPLRDDGEPALTFRGMFLATILSAFQAVMSQIYQVRQICTLHPVVDGQDTKQMKVTNHLHP